MGSANRLDVIVVIPYGNANGALHLAFDGDYKTFCGRNCEEWVPGETTVAASVNSAYCCKRCRLAYLR